MASETQTNAVENATDTAKTAFADLVARAKAASAQAGARNVQVLKFSQDNFEAFRAASKIVVDGARPLALEAVSNVRKQFEAVVASLQELTSAKSPAEALELQSEAVKAQFEAMRADSEAMVKALTALAGEAAKPLKGRVAAIRELAKAA